jgi:hypothetical protein
MEERKKVYREAMEWQRAQNTELHKKHAERFKQVISHKSKITGMLPSFTSMAS